LQDSSAQWTSLVALSDYAWYSIAFTAEKNDIHPDGKYAKCRFFYGPDFITITKAADANWAHIKPEVFSLITEAVNSGEQMVSTTNDKTSPAAQHGNAPNSLAYDEQDSEVVAMVKELLETRIRPAIQDDGGDVDYCGFENGKIEEVRGVTQVLDEAELTSDAEFARFEEKLREKQRSERSSLTAAKGERAIAEV
ncbi:MAG: hypothetical protein Q9188_001684, partial [Gyalolechia gomerana]